MRPRRPRTKELGQLANTQRPNTRHDDSDSAAAAAAIATGAQPRLRAALRTAVTAVRTYIAQQRCSYVKTNRDSRLTQIEAVLRPEYLRYEAAGASSATGDIISSFHRLASVSYNKAVFGQRVKQAAHGSEAANTIKTPLPGSRTRTSKRGGTNRNQPIKLKSIV